MNRFPGDHKYVQSAYVPVVHRWLMANAFKLYYRHHKPIVYVTNIKIIFVNSNNNNHSILFCPLSNVFCLFSINIKCMDHFGQKIFNSYLYAHSRSKFHLLYSFCVLVILLSSIWFHIIKTVVVLNEVKRVNEICNWFFSFLIYPIAMSNRHSKQNQLIFFSSFQLN